MGKYRFHLETLQTVREARRDERLIALAEAFYAEQLLVATRAEVAAEDAALRELQCSAVAEQYLDVNRLLEAQRYELVLKARSQELAKQATLLNAEIERRRQALVESDRDVRVLELLDERHRREHKRHAARMDIKQLDEAAMIGRSRRFT